jgi:hypothetical protein
MAATLPAGIWSAIKNRGPKSDPSLVLWFGVTVTYLAARLRRQRRGLLWRAWSTRRRLGREIWVAGKDPTAVLPRTKGIRIQPAPRGSVANLSHQVSRHHLLLEIGGGESRERESQTMVKFTRGPLPATATRGRKESGSAAPRLFLQAGQTGQGKSFAPLANDLPGCV